MKEAFVGFLLGIVFACLLVVTLVDMSGSYEPPTVTFGEIK